MRVRATTPGRCLAGAVLVLAAVIMITGAAIGFVAPSLREAPPFVTTDVHRVAPAIGGNPSAWVWANGLILTAGLLTALALVPVSLRLDGAGRPWAVAALVAFATGATLGAVDRMISMHVTTWAVQLYPDPTALAIWEAFDRLRLGGAFYLLAFVSIGLYGVAIGQWGASGLGWGFVAVAGGGIVLELVGAAIPAYIFLATAGLGVVSWQLDTPRGGDP